MGRKSGNFKITIVFGESLSQVNFERIYSHQSKFAIQLGKTAIINLNLKTYEKNTHFSKQQKGNF